MIRSVLCLTFCVLVVMLLNQKDAHAKDILPPAPHAFIAVTTDVGVIFNACPTPPNSGGYMKCGGSGELGVNINTGRFTKYSSDVMYLFAWEENKDFDIIEPVSVTLGDCRKLF